MITIINRKPSEQKSYAAIKDRIRQKLEAEKMAEYMKSVTSHHPLTWKIENHQVAAQADLTN